MRKLLFKCLILSAIFTMVGCSDDIMDSNYHPDLENSPTFGVVEKRQEIASLIYQDLLESFKTGNTKSVITSIDYPEFYGGAFVNEEGNLVINIVGDSIKSSLLLSERVGNEVQRQVCEYSYKELSSAVEELNRYMLDENNNTTIERLGFVGFDLSDRDNKIFVKLENCSSDAIREFKAEIANYPFIEFQRSEGIPVVHANINCGSGIESGNTGSYNLGSVGYRAKKWDGSVGVVTCAHVITRPYQDVYINGVMVGASDDWQMSGSIDATFCDITNSSYVPTNNVEGSSDVVGTSVVEPLQGILVKARGNTTKAVVSGNILSSSTTSTFNLSDGSKLTLTNIASASYHGASGDSGGIVYTALGTYGIHEGGTGTISYFIKASLINNAFGLTRY